MRPAGEQGGLASVTALLPPPVSVTPVPAWQGLLSSFSNQLSL